MPDNPEPEKVDWSSMQRAKLSPWTSPFMHRGLWLEAERDRLAAEVERLKGLIRRAMPVVEHDVYHLAASSDHLHHQGPDANCDSECATYINMVGLYDEMKQSCKESP